MYPFIKHTTIPDLGFGGGFALWGFRAIAGGQGNCCQLNVGFNKAFSIDTQFGNVRQGGTRGRLAINAMKSFAYQIGNTGKRKVILSTSGTLNLTADEICIVAALSTAQSGDDALCQAHLTWLLKTSNTELPYHAAVTYGLICSESGIEIKRPNVAMNSVAYRDVVMQDSERRSALALAP